MRSSSKVVATQTFNGERYEVRCSTAEDVIAVGVEALGSGEQWRGDFSARFIEEELTRRTGSYKSFKMFARMLEMAISNSAHSLFIDLLTYGDLERLRAGKTAKDGGNNAAAEAAAVRTPPQSSKRYLILTYTAEFDRVNYPLPLEFVAAEEPKALRRVIARLREQLAASKLAAASKAGSDGAASKAAQRLERANEAMRHEIEALRAQAREQAEMRDASQEERKRRLHNEIDRLHELNASALDDGEAAAKRHAQEAEELQREVATLKVRTSELENALRRNRDRALPTHLASSSARGRSIRTVG